MCVVDVTYHIYSLNNEFCLLEYERLYYISVRFVTFVYYHLAFNVYKCGHKHSTI